MYLRKNMLTNWNLISVTILIVLLKGHVLRIPLFYKAFGKVMLFKITWIHGCGEVGLRVSEHMPRWKPCAWCLCAFSWDLIPQGGAEYAHAGSPPHPAQVGRGALQTPSQATGTPSPCLHIAPLNPLMASCMSCHLRGTEAQVKNIWTTASFFFFLLFAF